MSELVYSARIYGYYAKQIEKELNLKPNETKVIPMNVTFTNKDVEGHTVIYYTLKSQKTAPVNPESDNNQIFQEQAQKLYSKIPEKA